MLTLFIGWKESMASPLVGIIANPASGRDIRRLVAHGTVFDNNEKTAIVRRVLLGLEAAGCERVAYMPEYDFGIVERARSGQHLALNAEPLAMPVLGTSADSTRAAQLLAEQGASCIITLGGDGTNRAVARGRGSVPLVPISTGTNNVFPYFVEGTTAGMAAGFVAAGCVAGSAIQRRPWLEVSVDGEAIESALIDVVISSLPFVGARALWDLATIQEVVLSRVMPGAIGLSALGGALLDHAVDDSEPPGMHIVLGRDKSAPTGGTRALAALAPGLVTWVGVAAHRIINAGEVVRCRAKSGENDPVGPFTVALDGERELELSAAARVEAHLRADGPFVVDVPAALEMAARAGYLQRPWHP
jgi:hypothetical protein